jgi:hypothetical protein
MRFESFNKMCRAARVITTTFSRIQYINNMLHKLKKPQFPEVSLVAGGRFELPPFPQGRV